MLVVGSVNVDLVVSVAVLPERGQTVAGGTVTSTRIYNVAI